MVADGGDVVSNQEKLYGAVPADGDADSELPEGRVTAAGVAVAVTDSGTGVGVGVGVGAGVGVGVGTGTHICIRPRDPPSSIPTHATTAGSTAPRLNFNLDLLKLVISNDLQ
jgi:hypothetical protein